MALGPRRRWGWVLGLCLLVAVADEVHQGLVPRRGFWLGDVGIDLVSGMLGAALGGTVVRPAGGSCRATYPASEVS